MDKAQIDLLIQQSIDGVLTADDEAQLAGILEQSPEAAAELEDFRAIDRIIGRLPQAPVPDGFSRRVMAALPKPVAAPRTAPRWSIATLFAMPALKLAYAAVAIVAVSVIGTLSLTGQLATSSGGAAGTMGGRTANAVTTELSTPAVNVGLEHRAEGLAHSLTARLDGLGTLTVAFPPSAYAVAGIDYLEGAAARTDIQADGLTLFFPEAASVRIRLETRETTAPAIDVLLADAAGLTAETQLNPSSRQ